MYEKHFEPLLPMRKFILRLGYSLLVGIVLIAIALYVGMYGYHHFEKMSWIDAFANAAMILSGMGPLGPLVSRGGKLFAGYYALFSGLMFIGVTGVVFSPVIHRFLHKFHLQLKG